MAHPERTPPDDVPDGPSPRRPHVCARKTRDQSGTYHRREQTWNDIRVHVREVLSPIGVLQHRFGEHARHTHRHEQRRQQTERTAPTAREPIDNQKSGYMQRGAGAEHEDHDPGDGTSPIPQPSVVPTNPEPRQYGQTRTLVLAMAGQVIPYVRHIHADIPSEQQNRPPHHATHRLRTLPPPRVRERSWRTSRTRRAHWARRNHASSRAGTHRPNRPRPNRPFHGTTPERDPNPNRHPSPCVPHNLHDALNRFFEHHCSIRCFCLMVFRSTHSSSSSSVMSYMICSSFRQMVTSAISSARLCSGSGLPRNRLLTA